MSIPHLAFLLVALATGFSSFAGSATGDVLPAYELSDASGQEQQLDNSIRRIYTTGDRQSAKVMERAMKGLDQSALDAQQAIVIADISEAPGFVKRMIRSSLKDRNYVTWVDNKGSTRKTLPHRPDRVGVIDLDQRRITAISHIPDVDSLKTELKKPFPGKPAAAPSP